MEDSPIQEVETVSNSIIAKTFLWMFFGLVVTGITAWLTYNSGLFITIILGDYWRGLLLLELLVVFVFSIFFRKLSPAFVATLYFLYAILNGVTLSTIFALFELQSIILLFFASAVVFGAMALYGYKTNKDMAKWGPIFFWVLLAGIIVSIINIFMKNSMVDIIVDWVMLFVFFGITAYDVKKIQQMEDLDVIDRNKLHIYGAMEIYLDFINIFIRILSIFGKRKD